MAPAERGAAESGRAEKFHSFLGLGAAACGDALDWKVCRFDVARLAVLRGGSARLVDLR